MLPKPSITKVLGRLHGSVPALRANLGFAQVQRGISQGGTPTAARLKGYMEGEGHLKPIPQKVKNKMNSVA